MYIKSSEQVRTYFVQQALNISQQFELLKESNLLNNRLIVEQLNKCEVLCVRQLFGSTSYASHELIIVVN